MTHSISFNEQIIYTDPLGYLLDSDDWSEDLCELIAEREEITLNDERWEIIRFVRQFYLDYDTSPAMRALVNALKSSFGPEKGNSRYLQRLFPKGPAKQASKLAGLPKPAKCL